MDNDDSTRASKKGGISELRGCYFTTGEIDSSLHFMDSKVAVAEYCGRQWGQELYDLLLDGTDYAPTAPTKPTAGRATRSTSTTDTTVPEPTVDPYELETYKQDYSHYLKTLQSYRRDKGRAFVTIMGQCSPRLKNKLAGLGPFKTLKKTSDVIGLLNLILSLVSSTTNKEYAYHTLVTLLAAYLTLYQKSDEDLADYEKRNKNAFDMLTNQWGELLPEKLPTGDNKDVAAEKLRAYIFLKGADNKRFSFLKKHLHNNHITESGTYPATLSDMITLLNEERPRHNGHNGYSKKTKSDDNANDNATINNQVTQDDDDPEPNTSGRRSTLKDTPKKTKRLSGGAFRVPRQSIQE